MESKVYQVITDRIVGLLEKGTIPWRKPWAGGGSPRNLCSGKEYRGVNVFLLSATAFSAPWWLTFNQAKDRGGSVKKGEHGFPVIYFQMLEKEDASKPRGKARIPLLRYYTVFNVGQCEGIEAPEVKLRPDVAPIEACERVVPYYPSPPHIVHGEPRAYYQPSTDRINLPERRLFDSAEEYYCTLFHELGHSTGHDKRLGRKGITDPVMFGSHGYSKEELVAEMTAAFLCGHCGIENATLDNSAAYIAGWLRKLRDDRKLVIEAAAQAQKAADLILGRRAVTGVEAEEESPSRAA